MHTVARNPIGLKARIKIASLNIKGRNSGNFEKWFHIPQLMREHRIGILAAQETHLTDDLADRFNTTFERSFLLIHSPDPDTRNARGVAFVINRSLMRMENLRVEVLAQGRALMLSVPWKDDTQLTVLNMYAPNVPQEM